MKGVSPKKIYLTGGEVIRLLTPFISYDFIDVLHRDRHGRTVCKALHINGTHLPGKRRDYDWLARVRGDPLCRVAVSRIEEFLEKVGLDPSMVEETFGFKIEKIRGEREGWL